jgi:hypothetical protein
MVPRTWGLLQTIESTVEVAHVIRMCRINEPSGLLIEHHLRELSMKEHVLDVELPYLPVAGERDGEDDPDDGRFNNRAEGLVEVDAVFLRETAQDPTGFIAVKRTIRLELVPKNPFAGDDVGVGGREHKISRVVGEKTAILISHGRELVRVFESTSNGLRNRRRSSGGGNVEIETLARADDLVGLSSSHHLSSWSDRSRRGRGRGRGGAGYIVIRHGRRWPAAR